MKMVPLGRVAAINPRVGGSTATNGAEEVAFLPMDAISEGGFVAYQQRRRISEVTNGYTCFKRGDILLAKITPCMENGKAAHLQALETESGFGSTEFHVIRPSDELDGRYTFYLIWNPRFRHLAECRMTGSAGQKRVPASFLKELEIPLPPVAEQRRIAAILDKADAIRRKHEQALALADDFLRSTFLHMFGDPFTNPRGWPVRPLGDLGEVKGGLQLTASRGANPIKVPYLRVANVFRDRLDLSEVKEMGVTKSELERTRLQRGDVLIVEGHGNPNEIGRSSVWNGLVETCTHQNHLIKFRANRKVAEPVYVSAFLTRLIHEAAARSGFSARVLEERARASGFLPVWLGWL